VPSTPGECGIVIGTQSNGSHAATIAAFKWRPSRKERYLDVRVEEDVGMVIVGFKVELAVLVQVIS
jgi:hypothetical protein